MVRSMVRCVQVVASDRTEKAVRKQAELIGGLQTGLATLEARLADYQVCAPRYAPSGLPETSKAGLTAQRIKQSASSSNYPHERRAPCLLVSLILRLKSPSRKTEGPYFAQEAMTSSSAAGSDADPADYLTGLRAVLDPASSEASSGTSAGPRLPFAPASSVVCSFEDLPTFIFKYITQLATLCAI